MRGLLHHIAFSLRVYSGCSQAPVVYGIYCLKGEAGAQEKSAGQLGIKSDAGPALAPSAGGRLKRTAFCAREGGLPFS